MSRAQETGSVLSDEEAVKRLEARARQVFDSFLVLQPDVPVEGLFRSGREYVIVSPAILSITSSGQTVKDWFQRDLRPAGMPMHLVDRQPALAEQLPPRTPKEALRGFGIVRASSDFIRDLALALPPGFPFVGMRVVGRTIVIGVARALSADEHGTLTAAFDAFGSVLPMEVEIDESRPLKEDVHRIDALELRPARLLAPSTPHAIRDAVEADDDLWRQAMAMSSLADVASRMQNLTPWSDTRNTACLVSTTFPPANIRSYLSLYPRVILVAPLKESLAPTLAALGLTDKELLELARRGDVHLLVPQSVERYDPAWLAGLLEAVPAGVVMSRRLAAIALQDQHRRNPLLALPANSFEKRTILQVLRRSADTAPAGVSAILRALAGALSEHWSFAEYTLHSRGAMASLSGGLARIGTAVVQELFKRDLFLQMSVAAQEVEWAGAFGAHLVPEEGLGYSSAGAASLLIALSSGASRAAPMITSPREFDLAEDLLAFDNDTDIIEFTTELGRGDLGRFRSLVRDIAQEAQTKDEIRESVRRWNEEVRRYDRRPDRVRSFNLLGVLLTAASMMSGNTALAQVVPVVALLLPYLYTKANEEAIRESSTIGSLLDWANGNAAGTRPQAVLLSRMRKRVAGMQVAPLGENSQ